jgi:hypothetical protein
MHIVTAILGRPQISFFFTDLDRGHQTRPVISGRTEITKSTEIPWWVMHEVLRFRQRGTHPDRRYIKPWWTDDAFWEFGEKQKQLD